MPFLSIQAQDFIEDVGKALDGRNGLEFLSIQAQDFIEDSETKPVTPAWGLFLSIQAQDFIEESLSPRRKEPNRPIPEHSSSGLH